MGIYCWLAMLVLLTCAQRIDGHMQDYLVFMISKCIQYSHSEFGFEYQFCSGKALSHLG